MLLSLLDPERLRRILERLFDSEEFLSSFGIRSLSAAARETVTAEVGGQHVSIEYEPGESRTGMFGGNSNWRGPIWFPVNVLLADKLRTYGRHFGDSFQIEIPTGSGNLRNLEQAADTIDHGLTALFQPVDGKRPADGERIEASDNPLWSEHPTFSEYFDGDTGEGLGATHQTGWTALVAHLLNPRLPPDPPKKPTAGRSTARCREARSRRRRVAFSARNRPTKEMLLRDCCPRHRPDRISRTRSGPRPGRSVPARERRMAGHRRHPGRPIDGRVRSTGCGTPPRRTAGRSWRRPPSWRRQARSRAARNS